MIPHHFSFSFNICCLSIPILNMYFVSLFSACTGLYSVYCFPYHTCYLFAKAWPCLSFNPSVLCEISNFSSSPWFVSVEVCWLVFCHSCGGKCIPLLTVLILPMDQISSFSTENFCIFYLSWNFGLCKSCHLLHSLFFLCICGLDMWLYFFLYGSMLHMDLIWVLCGFALRVCLNFFTMSTWTKCY